MAEFDYDAEITLEEVTVPEEVKEGAHSVNIYYWDYLGDDLYLYVYDSNYPPKHFLKSRSMYRMWKDAIHSDVVDVNGNKRVNTYLGNAIRIRKKIVDGREVFVYEYDRMTIFMKEVWRKK